jgi:hypothetical protein
MIRALFFLLAGAVILAAPAFAKTTLPLRPFGASGVSGTAVPLGVGSRTEVIFTVRGLRAGAIVRGQLRAGTCRRASASVAAIGSAKADAKGVAHWRAFIVLHGGDIPFRSVVDGGHNLTVAGPRGAVACGLVPRVE